jgi:hypothetical protein
MGAMSLHREADVCAAATVSRGSCTGTNSAQLAALATVYEPVREEASPGIRCATLKRRNPLKPAKPR